MRGLTILVTGSDPARFRSALELAAVQAALGARSRLFLQTVAVPLLAEEDGGDARYAAAGLPTRGELIDTCLALGAEIMVCQSGLALAGLKLATLDARFAASGLTGLLAGIDDDRLVMV